MRGLIRAVVFDVGETLVDETRAWGQMADAAGVTRLTLFGALGALIERGEDHRRVWALLGVARPSGEPEIRVEDLYPDAEPCLRALKLAGYTVALAGNQPAGAERVLRALGLPVDYVATSSGWGVEKPSPEFFARIVTEARVEPREILYVGDRLDNDVLPALEVGMRSVLVRRGPWGYIHARRPEAARADAVLDSLAELPGLMVDLVARRRHSP
jgi:HAD superfamily hydrolase (TIGR01662 family)